MKNGNGSVAVQWWFWHDVISVIPRLAVEHRKGHRWFNITNFSSAALLQLLYWLHYLLVRLSAPFMQAELLCCWVSIWLSAEG